MAAPVKVVYEAGPTGYGLARHLLAIGIDCVVAAPSKLIRPQGDRVKTDARDARHLARLLYLGEVVAVQIAGLLARRIVCDVKAGDTVGIGETYGLIRYGSRLDTYLPAGSTVLAEVGQRTLAGETVLAELP